jgi:lipopolysaccharide assembly protein B
MPELVWILIPLAIAIGWYASKYHAHILSLKTSECGSAYYKSINYLLNEQPDKAIEVFIEMLEVDNETVETHLALGSLFRRRGEVDRAIRIHQNLIARTSLSEEQKTLALSELGQDYMKAGLFDRAESLFLELVDLNAHSESALRFLLTIYQQEKEWYKAIHTAEKLQDIDAPSMSPEIAHYYCEIAEEYLRKNEDEQVFELLNRAREFDPNCVRATIMLGTIYMQSGDYQSAVSQFSNVHKQDSEFCPQVLPKLLECHENLDGVKSMVTYLEHILKDHFSVPLMLVLANLIQETEGDRKATSFLAAQLRIHPSIQGLERFVGLTIPHTESDERERLTILQDMMNKLLNDRPEFKCQNCGFEGKTLHWQCPRCKTWAQTKPIQGGQES